MRKFQASFGSVSAEFRSLFAALCWARNYALSFYLLDGVKFGDVIDTETGEIYESYENGLTAFSNLPESYWHGAIYEVKKA